MVGMVLWNVFNKIPVARKVRFNYIFFILQVSSFLSNIYFSLKILKEGLTTDKLAEAAKLFDLHE